MRRRLVVLLIALHALPASASDRDPLDFPLRQYAFILAISLLGGMVSWYAKVRQGTVQAWNVMHLIGELATSAFAGLLAFWFCAWANTPPLIAAALVGVAGHMGARAIGAFEEWAQRKFGSTATPEGP